MNNPHTPLNGTAVTNKLEQALTRSTSPSTRTAHHLAAALADDGPDGTCGATKSAPSKVTDPTQGQVGHIGYRRRDPLTEAFESMGY